MTKKLSYEYLLTDDVQTSVIRPFLKYQYNMDVSDAKEAASLWLEHNRKFNIGNEITVFNDLSYVRDQGIINGGDQITRLANYKESTNLFDNYESGFKTSENNWNVIADYAEGFLKSPSLYLSLFIGGTGKGAQMAASRLTQESIKQYAKTHGLKYSKDGFNASIRKEMLKNFGKEYAGKGYTREAKSNLYKKVIGDRVPVAGQAVKAGLTEAGIAGLADVGRQSVELEGKEYNLEYQKRDKRSLGQTVGAMAFAGTIAGGLTYPLAKWQADKANRIANVIEYRGHKKDLHIKKLKEEAAGDPARIKNVAKIKRLVNEEADEAFKEIGEKGQLLLAKKFGVTSLTHAQVRAGVNENLAYVIDNLIQENPNLLKSLMPKKGEKLTHNIFAHLESGDIPLDSLRKQMNEFGVGLDDMRFMWWSSVSNAGKTLGIWGQLRKSMNSNVDKTYDDLIKKGVDDEAMTKWLKTLGRQGFLTGKTGASLQQLEKEAFQAAYSNSTMSLGSSLRAIDNLRRGLMVSQPKTAIRNALSVGIKMPADMFARYIDNGLALSLMKYNKSKGKEMGIISNVNMNDATTYFRYLFNNAEAGTLTDKLLSMIDGDSYASRSFYQAYNEVSYRMAKEEGGSIASKTLHGAQKLTDFVNIMNRTQEHLFRRVAFMSSIERQLGRLNIIGDVKKGGARYSSMHDLISKGGLEDTAIWLNKDWDVMGRAIDDAMEFTFQGRTARNIEDLPGSRSRPKTKAMHAYDSFMKGFVNIVTQYGGTPLVPFPRFLYNALKYMGEYSPIGLLDAASSTVFRKARQNFYEYKGKIDDEVVGKNIKNIGKSKRTSESTYDFSAIGKGLTGTLMYVGAYQFRNSQYAGDKWDEVRIPKGSLLDYGNVVEDRNLTMSLATIGPNVGPYMFIADYVKKNLEGNKPLTNAIIDEYGGDLDKLKELGHVSSGPRAYKTWGGFWREFSKATIGTQARVGVLSSFLDDIFTPGVDLTEEEASKNMLRILSPFQSLAGDYISGFATPFSVASDALGAWDGAEDIVRETRFKPLTSKFKNRIPEVFLNFINLEKEIPAPDPFGTGFRRKTAPITSQLTGFQVMRKENTFKSEMDRLGFKYQDAIIWDESPALTYAYKEAFSYGLNSATPDINKYLDSYSYQQKGDYEKALYMKELISMLRNVARDHMKTRFPSEFNNDPLYEAVSMLRNLTIEEKRVLEKMGGIEKALELYGVSSGEELEEEMQRQIKKGFKGKKIR
tara:strand:- start:26 stop:3748 length:3723 start_codon:yes stop_codon:yes gene_type:complete